MFFLVGSVHVIVSRQTPIWSGDAVSVPSYKSCCHSCPFPSVAAKMTRKQCTATGLYTCDCLVVKAIGHLAQCWQADCCALAIMSSYSMLLLSSSQQKG